tara:strand:- start:540 stop:908 length:369 start_codon:yes stop_codon:yes gene_type:complete
MKKILIITLLFWGCNYAPTEHTHDHEHSDLYNGCCVQYHPSNIAYTFINEDGNELSFSSSGAQYYYHNTNQVGCLSLESYEEYDEILWDYIDNQTCSELCSDDTSIFHSCFIDSISILIPNP